MIKEIKTAVVENSITDPSINATSVKTNNNDIGQELTLPLLFYHTSRSKFFILTFIIIVIGVLLLAYQSSPDKLGVKVIVVGIGFCVVGLLIWLVVIFSRKPYLSIYPTHVALFSLWHKDFQRKISFKDVADMKLRYILYRDYKRWQLLMTLDNGKKYPILLDGLRMQGQANNQYVKAGKLNEKEVYHLIEQVYHGNLTPKFQAFTMTIKDKMTKTGQVMTGFMIIMLIIAIIFGFSAAHS